MAINNPPSLGATTAAARTLPPRPNPNDPIRGDHMNPYGKTRSAMNMSWIVAAIIVTVLVLGYVYMQQGTSTLPPGSIGKTDQTQPVTPSQSTPTTP